MASCGRVFTCWLVTIPNRNANALSSYCPNLVIDDEGLMQRARINFANPYAPQTVVRRLH